MDMYNAAQMAASSMIALVVVRSHRDMDMVLNRYCICMYMTNNAVTIPNTNRMLVKSIMIV